MKLWGFGTWTDGPVAVTDLAASLDMPLTYDYAFGSSQGGENIGSVCSNALLPAGHLSGHAKLSPGVLVPDALGQIKNYTSSGVYNKAIATTLHFLWTANNDMIASLASAGRFTICDKDTLCHAGQQTFIKNVLGCVKTSLTNLIKAGAMRKQPPLETGPIEFPLTLFARYHGAQCVSPRQGSLDESIY